MNEGIVLIGKNLFVEEAVGPSITIGEGDNWIRFFPDGRTEQGPKYESSIVFEMIKAALMPQD